jgi:50S ribosomal protein L16 3-hydroxylase
MLVDWLGRMPIDEFRSRFLRIAPTAQPGTALAARSLLDWHVLDRVLRAAPDVLVVSRGALLSIPPPRTVHELAEYFAGGVGLCIRHAQRHDAGLATVAAAFESLGSAQVQLFVTPAGTHGFGWHYDDEDVFIAQAAGMKDYYFRANTVADSPASPVMFERYHRETSPLGTATLVAGDFLYVPSRWWHMAICHQHALSISVGVRLRESGSQRS